MPAAAAEMVGPSVASTGLDPAIARTSSDCPGEPGSGAGACTRSPSTAPASIEASWSGSPTRTSRASGRTASSSRAISGSETIDVSSTMTTSWGSGFDRSCRNRPCASGAPAEQSVQRRGDRLPDAVAVLPGPS